MVFSFVEIGEVVLVVSEFMIAVVLVLDDLFVLSDVHADKNIRERIAIKINVVLCI